VRSVGRQSECGAVCEWVDGRVRREGGRGDRGAGERNRRDYQSAVGFELC
jgi:hypothetical protein